MNRLDLIHVFSSWKVAYCTLSKGCVGEKKGRDAHFSGLTRRCGSPHYKIKYVDSGPESLFPNLFFLGFGNPVGFHRVLSCTMSHHVSISKEKRDSGPNPRSRGKTGIRARISFYFTYALCQSSLLRHILT